MIYVIGLFVLMSCMTSFCLWKVNKDGNYETAYGLMLFLGAIVSIVSLMVILFMISWKLLLTFMIFLVAYFYFTNPDRQA